MDNETKPSNSAVEIDPVCGMKVDRASARFFAEHDNKRYFFCCGGCMTKFQADPLKILNSAPKPMGSGFVGLGIVGAVKPTAAKVKDPVCGMEVDPQTAKFKNSHE